ncbi:MULTISPECIES: hypothetical protein [unclassified Streptomyces]|uniref:hypothetical protein n=1 Tax=unclassified Streptomyces TaxID=2593676 RepID=UPI000AB7FEE4|nr:hypothetical protein [Streptomyces sp. TSRI0107]
MGERLSGDGAPDRLHTHYPGTSASGPLDEDTGRLEAWLAATMRTNGVDAEAEGRAVAAFRAAREAGARRPRTRRRDDWRPRTRPGLARSAKAALSLFAVSLTLGGVAVAAIGSAGSPGRDTADEHRRTTPSHSARSQPADPTAGRPSARPSVPASGTGPARPDRPSAAADTEAHCRAFEQVGGRGKALDATAWQRLVAAAGGAEKVAAYCAALGEDARTNPDERGGPDGTDGTGANAGRSAPPGDQAKPDEQGEQGEQAGQSEKNEPGQAKGKKE